MLYYGYLPSYEQHQTGEEKTPGKKVSDEQHRREHHKISPIKDAAVDAAFILYYKRLERAPDNHAYQVTHIVEGGKEQQLMWSNDVGHIQNAENRIEAEPYQQYTHSGKIIYLHIFVHLKPVVVICRTEMLGKALLASHCNTTVGGEKLGYHAQHENSPYHIHPGFFQFLRSEYVYSQYNQKDYAAKNQLSHIFLKHVYLRYLLHFITS